MPSRRGFVLSSASLLAAACAPPLSAAEIGAREKAVLALAQTYSAVRYFYPGDVAEKLPWDRFLLAATARALEVNDRAKIGPLLRELFSPVAPGIEFAQAPLAPSGRTIQPSDVYWNHYGLGVGQATRGNTYFSFRRNRPGESDKIAPASGPAEATFPIAGDWHVRMPIALSPIDASAGAAPPLPNWDDAPEGMRREHIIAIGIAAWAIAAQFYPYWDTVKVDWNGALLAWVRQVPERAGRVATVRHLQRLVAKLVDGHAGVDDSVGGAPRSMLPIDVRPMDDGYVVTTSLVPQVVSVGDRILAVDGHPIEEARRQWEAELSGTPQFLAWAARTRLLQGEAKSKVRLRLANATRDRDAVLMYDSGMLVPPRRGDRELQPGIRYVDVPWFDPAQFERDMDDLRKARAVIFDLRGYPSPRAIELVPFWTRHAAAPKWMHVPIRTRPFAPPDRYHDLGWPLGHDARLEGARKILLTDGRAISYAESLTGVFVGTGAGRTVGEPTAGANGDISRHALPGGYGFRFTGLVVHDFEGKPIHARGFQPDVPVKPTVEGIRAGRDEVLEKAIQIASA